MTVPPTGAPASGAADPTSGHRTWWLGLGALAACSITIAAAAGPSRRWLLAPIAHPASGAASSQRSGDPSASNTGVPPGVSLTTSHDLNVTQAGVVINGLDIWGSLTVSANNVTIQRSRIHNADQNTVRVMDGVTGTSLLDCEIDGLGQTEGNNGVYGRATVRRCNIHGVENGVVLDSGSTMKDSYIHDLAAPGLPHYDGIQLDGGRSDIVIDHNTIINNHDQTSAIMVDNYYGPISNIRINNNILSGGTYTVYADGQFSAGAIKGVTVTNNRFGEHQFGYANIRATVLARVSGNVDDVTGQPISL